MEFGFTKEWENFRKEVREFFISELPGDFELDSLGMTEEAQSFWMQLQKKVAKVGWITASWPKKYGGMGLTAIEQGIFEEEASYFGIWWPTQQGFVQAAPAIILFGSEEQKKRFIPPIAKGEVVWFQAFSEPDAGSDEANVQLRAVENGDYFILNGQKTFISGAYKPDYLYTLAKTTDVVPKHRGLSLFLIPADLPGISYRPLLTMGDGTQNEIFFDDVRAPKDSLVGELNRGFYHTMATYEFERSGTRWVAGPKRELEEFVQFCKEEKRNGKLLIEDPEIRKILARRTIEVEVARLAGWFGTWWSTERERLGPQPASVSSRFYVKIFGEHWAKDTMDLLGLYGQLRQDSKGVKFAGRTERRWQTARSTHAGGTVEIYKNVLAQRGLDLPRPPRPVATAKTS